VYQRARQAAKRVLFVHDGDVVMVVVVVPGFRRLSPRGLLLGLRRVPASVTNLFHLEDCWTEHVHCARWMCAKLLLSAAYERDVGIHALVEAWGRVGGWGGAPCALVRVLAMLVMAHGERHVAVLRGRPWRQLHGRRCGRQVHNTRRCCAVGGGRVRRCRPVLWRDGALLMESAAVMHSGW
jgi:hypothetical protein